MAVLTVIALTHFEEDTMPYLDAALAFALTMLAVSTLVTQIVRVIQKASALRNKVLLQMLNEYFAQELRPVIDRELSRLKSDLKSDLKNEVAAGVSEKAQALSMNLLFTEEELARLTEVSTEELLERLKRSNMGKDLLENLGSRAQAVFNELGKRYEILGNKFSELFRVNSRLLTTILAIVIAFLLNVDSLYIVDTYVKNEGMRQAVIAQKESLEDGYRALTVKLEQDPARDSITKAEFEQAFGDAKEQLGIFAGAGFPIGISYFPYVCFQNPTAPDCGQRNIIFWSIGCILTGLLAGLGAPFWYDAVTGISRAIQSMRAEKKQETDA